MNVSMNNINNSVILGNKTRNTQQQRNFNQPAFTGSGAKATKIVSKYFEPLKKLMEPVTIPISKAYNSFTNFIARQEAKLLGANWLKKTIEFSNKKNIDVVKHISAINGIIIASLYIHKTMKNDKLDPDKKVTLSINQGIVAAVATVAGYSVDKLVGNAVDKYARKFFAVNYNLERDKLGKLKGGLRAAASMMVFGTMYRYIAPVLVTPIANKIGNNVHDKKIAKLKAQQGLSTTGEAKSSDKNLNSQPVVSSAVAFANAPAAGADRPILQNLMAQKFS